MRNEIYNIITEIKTVLISGAVSVITYIILIKFEFNKKEKEEKFKRFYNKFYVLRDVIHQGRAYDFTDLSIYIIF